MLIVGGGGFLGSCLARSLTSMKVSAPGRDALDLGQPVSPEVLAQFEARQFSYVLICGGITDVERCAREPALSEQVNVRGTIALLELAKKSGAKPIFFSSDYVFAAGTGNYTEEAATEPDTEYGKQKLAAEDYIRENFAHYLIFRTSKLMSKSLHPRNILSPLLQAFAQNKPARCFTDQWINPVFVEDIAEIVRLAAEKKLNGTFHLGTKKIFSREELGLFLADALGHDAALIQPIQMADIAFSEKRSHHNTIACGKIEKALGFRFCEVEDALAELAPYTK